MTILTPVTYDALRRAKAVADISKCDATKSDKNYVIALLERARISEIQWFFYDRLGFSDLRKDTKSSRTKRQSALEIFGCFSEKIRAKLLS